jgi:transcriptional regulator CtsR
MEVLDMAISEKELKLLMNFIKDDLTEAKESDKEEIKNQKIERVLEHIQQYLED